MLTKTMRVLVEELKVEILLLEGKKLRYSFFIFLRSLIIYIINIFYFSSLTKCSKDTS